MIIAKGNHYKKNQLSILIKSRENLPRTYQKLLCKEEPYRYSGERDPSVQTDTQTHTDTVTLL